MTDTPKSIQEALAEVQRRVNEERARRVAEMVQQIEEDNLDEAGFVSGLYNTGKAILSKPSARKIAVSNVKNAFNKGYEGISGKISMKNPATGKAQAMGPVGKGIEKVGQAAAAVKNNPKTAAAGALGTAAVAGAGSSTPKTNTPGTQGVATGKSFAAIDKAKSTPSTPAKPAIDSSAKGAKFAGGKPHSVTTLAPTAPGTQGKVQSKTTEKGWADPGRWENEAKSKTGSMQQIRGGKVLPPSSQLGTPKDEKSTQSFLSKELGKKTANPQGPGMSGSSESGKSYKKKVSESLIQGFLELMNANEGNIFESAKHLSAKQKKIASVAGDPNKIDADDFKVLRSKKMEEASVDHLGSSTVTKSKTGYVDPSTPTKPYTKAPMSTKAGDVISKAKGAAGMKEEVDLDDFIEYHLEEGYDINDIVDFIEENYQLDELSKTTLQSYKKKATASAAYHAKQYGRAVRGSRPKQNIGHVSYHGRKFDNRETGLKRAESKISEEVEFSESELEYINSVMNTEGDNE